ncbi:hypothetical protein PUNSTDRAFT_136152 [Punctularia strigosozonata HHB-11173 SS5]|uniref:uncharacterized protein n=1 Tax=Punctularia strigosozonata (strain HHB-11173) TaxID=741275 RepID=UPI0004417099|nr:uncharacterized protein PUNSTDRAFT_136152 [Punctularia strigosozonata HHB-11173 SS5]EIN07472.1 hypothetical protein PUNSTDRAFT_136152 [Punctularia strigosozonata HHB-11173 SS5]
MIDNVVLAARYLNALVRLLGQECLLQDQSVCRLRVGIKDRIDSLDWIAATDPSIRESLNELRALLDVSHMLRLQQLTPEAMSRIIRHIDGNDEERAFSLCSMALACRALRRPAQAAIFKTLNIDNPRILDAVASAINGSPQLGSYVRELCLEIKHHTSGDWLEGLSRFSTRLSALYVVKIQGVSWTALGANAKQAILQTVTRAPALVLQSWKSFETQSMLDIMLACQNLESLAVRFCELRTCNVDQTKPNVETSLCPSLRHIELADNLRGANNLGHTLLSFTKLDSLTSVTVHLSSIMKQHIGGMVLHRLLTQVSCPKTYLHVSRVCDVCASGDSDSPWPTSQQFLTLLVPRALDEGENASTDLEDWFYDVLSVLYMPGTLWMQSTIVGTDEREAHLSTWQLRSHPRISSSPVPPGIRWFPPRALASYDEDEHLEERWRRAVVVRLSRLNAIPTYCVHRPAGDTVATAGSAREFTAS